MWQYIHKLSFPKERRVKTFETVSNFFSVLIFAWNMLLFRNLNYSQKSETTWGGLTQRCNGGENVIMSTHVQTNTCKYETCTKCCKVMQTLTATAVGGIDIGNCNSEPNTAWHWNWRDKTCAHCVTFHRCDSQVCAYSGCIWSVHVPYLNKL